MGGGRPTRSARPAVMAMGDRHQAVTGLADDVRAELDRAHAMVAPVLGPVLALGLQTAHDAVVAMCRDDEQQTAVTVSLLNDVMDELEDQ